jgi:hypothetical protein
VEKGREANEASGCVDNSIENKKFLSQYRKKGAVVPEKNLRFGSPYPFG